MLLDTQLMARVIVADGDVLRERLATYASFSVSQGGHIGIGMLPLVFFGTEEQKQRWLPRMA